jgi:non-ribosomal peptide synthase protein (TIGR01720 family)
LHSSAAFDMSITSIFLPIIRGDYIEIIPDYLEINLLKLITDKPKASFIKLTPAHLRILKNQFNLEESFDIEVGLIVGGENLSKEDIEFLSQVNHRAFIYNEYGPTEATVGCCVFELINLSLMSIGRPIWNTQIYILDVHMNVIPVGVVGEIYIGGVGLARGYLNQPGLTAEKFVANPFISEKDYKLSKNLRLYRTGDLGRYLPDGNIEFLGRIDDQVKIRGFRIELGEIESNLVNHQDVQQVSVIAREDEVDQKRIVAYIVVKEGILSSMFEYSEHKSSTGEVFKVLGGDSVVHLTESLRDYLGLVLPDYMIPSFFVFITKMPLTSNGKIDRKSLPSPDLSSRQNSEEYIAPRTEVEQQLSEIWSEVLKVKNIGIHDNFFKIGGDSIISIQVVARSRQKNIYFSVKDLFNCPTIAELATLAKFEIKESVFKAFQGKVVGDILLTPIQKWFFEKDFCFKSHFNQATLLELGYKVDISLLKETCKKLISHHDMLTASYYRNSSGVWQQKCEYTEEGFKDWLEVDLSKIVDNNLSQEIEEYSTKAQASLDIENGVLVKIVFFNCGPNRLNRLLLVIHHLVVDGVSWRILIEDLNTIYNQLVRNEDISLPMKTHSYQQWSFSLQKYANSVEIKDEITYWHNVEPFDYILPTDFDRGYATVSQMKSLLLCLNEIETLNLLQRVPKAYRTQINDILLTALVLSMGEWQGHYKVNLSLEGHGREEIIKNIDLSRTVGWFTSIFPVYLSLDKPEDLGESLKQVKEELRRIPNKGIGYGVLKYLSSEQIDLLKGCNYPRISFNYLGQWDNTLIEDSLFKFAKEFTGESVCGENESPYLIDINAEVIQGRLNVYWGYSTQHYNLESMEKLSLNFISKLKLLIEHCCQENNFGYTSSDFSLVNLDQAMLVKQMIEK